MAMRIASCLQADPYKDTPKSIFGLLHGLAGGATLELSEQGKLCLNYGALIDGGIGLTGSCAAFGSSRRQPVSNRFSTWLNSSFPAHFPRRRYSHRSRPIESF